MSISEAPSTSMTSQQGRPEQGKFGKEEVNFLKTHLPAYGALCDGLAKQATGPRGTGSVKGCKKDWILSKVFPEFVKRFSSDQNGGPQPQSLQAVSYYFSLSAVARMLVETIAMVLESLPSSEFWFGFESTTNGFAYKASVRH